MQTALEPAWITYEEAGRLASLGRTTLRRLVDAGEIRTAHLGRAVRLNRRDLERAMERRTGGVGDGA